jgi:hypothetical protein
MKTKWILTLISLSIVQATFAVSTSRTISMDEFKKSVQNLGKIQSAKTFSDQSPVPQPPDQLPPPATPIRSGKAKLTLTKGVFQTEGDNKWNFVWSPVCEKDVIFNVYETGEPNVTFPIHSCDTSFDGKEIKLNFGVVAAEGNVEVNPGDGGRHMTMYAVPAFSITNIALEGYPISSTPVVGLEERSNKDVILVNQADQMVICMTTGEGDTKPKPQHFSDIGKNSLKSKNDDNTVCQPVWKELFRVTAEILD